MDEVHGFVYWCSTGNNVVTRSRFDGSEETRIHEFSKWSDVQWGMVGWCGVVWCGVVWGGME